MPTHFEDLIAAVDRATAAIGRPESYAPRLAVIPPLTWHSGHDQFVIDETTTLKELFMDTKLPDTITPIEVQPSHIWGGTAYTDEALAQRAFERYANAGDRRYALALMRTEHAGRYISRSTGLNDAVALWPQYAGSPVVCHGKVYFARFSGFGYSLDRLDLDWFYLEDGAAGDIASPDESIRRRGINRARLAFMAYAVRTPGYVDANNVSRYVRTRTERKRSRAAGQEIGRRMAELRNCDTYDSEVEEFTQYVETCAIGSGVIRNILARATLSDGYSLADHGFEYATACRHIHTNTRELHDGRTACENCVDNGDYVEAENNGEYYPVGDLYEHSDGLYYTYEEDEDDDEGSDDPYRIMEYSTNVMDYLRTDSSFTSSSNGDFHMGVEFESVWVGPDRALYSKITELYDDGYAVAKYDGSIGNGRVSGTSVEWVTQPTSLARHIETFGEWDMTHMRAWDCRSCGMHVHVDSKAFTKATLAKIIAVYNSKENAQFLRSIAGRHPDTDNQARDYANFDSELSDDTPPLDPAAFAKIWKGKVGNGQGRYTMVNLCNLGRREGRRLGLKYADGGESNTVEFRLFRASTRKARLLAQLEFVHATIVWARQAGIRQCLQMEPHFRAWIATRGDYPNLRAWLRTHREHGRRLRAAGQVSLSVDDEADVPSAAATA